MTEAASERKPEEAPWVFPENRLRPLRRRTPRRSARQSTRPQPVLCALEAIEAHGLGGPPRFVECDCKVWYVDAEDLVEPSRAGGSAQPCESHLVVRLELVLRGLEAHTQSQLAGDVPVHVACGRHLRIERGRRVAVQDVPRSDLTRGAE